MASFSGVGIGLSLVFSCLLLAFVAELYYLLWWKKRDTNREIEVEYNHYAKDLFYIFCLKKPSSAPHIINTTNNQEHHSNGSEPDIELGSSKDVFLKSFGEESVESELMRLHNLSGPPRFLFTINEETKEDLESEDGKSREGRSRKGSRTGSLSDVLVNNIETPVASPLVKPISPFHNPLDCYSHHGFNPLFESSAEAELNRFRSSPPPKFKFLRDAEEKLFRRLLEEAEKRAIKNHGHAQDFGVKIPDKKEEERDGKLKERETHHHLPPQYNSTSTQVLPVSSPPTSTLKPRVHELP